MIPAGPARLRFGAAVNIVWDGNSLVYGRAAGVGQRVTDQVAALAPVAGTGALTTNLGIDGQTWLDMANGAADVDGAWVAGKTNLLILWETTNDIANIGRTATQAAADAHAYIAARTAANPWTVALLTTLPRQAASMAQGDTDALNASLLAWDDLARANWRAWGAHALVDLRQPGSPFAFPDFAAARWDATRPLWTDRDPAIHLTPAGYGVVARLVAAQLRRLPVRR